MYQKLKNEDDSPTSTPKLAESDATVRSQTLNKAEKKKGFSTGTMKPMSAHDQKTLDTAVAMANELTTRSMNDLDEAPKVPPSPSEKSKFHFKFPLVSSLHHHSNSPPEPEPKESSTKPERRNFSEEANSVPDIQESLTEESKMAYASLIEEPVKNSTLISHIAQDGQSQVKPATMPKPTPKVESPQFSSLRYSRHTDTHYEVFLPNPSKRATTTFIINDETIWRFRNNLPLPQQPNRDTKPKLVDKPRHIRKHPLITPESTPPPIIRQKPILNIYQNFGTCQMEVKAENKKQYQNLDSQETDLVDSVDGAVKDTNPFTITQAVVNPFVDTVDGPTKEPVAGPSAPYFEERSLLKDCTDHVSVEDLLEFADQKPCGRQRGVESDEVRIMAKVLKDEVTPEDCLEALELADWNVHYAIKIIRVRVTTENVVPLEACARFLAASKGDIVKAALCITKQRQDN